MAVGGMEIVGVGSADAVTVTVGVGSGVAEAAAGEACTGVAGRSGVAGDAWRSSSGATRSAGMVCANAAPDRPSRSSGISRMRVFGSMRIKPLLSFAMCDCPPEPPC